MSEFVKKHYAINNKRTVWNPHICRYRFMWKHYFFQQLCGVFQFSCTKTMENRKKKYYTFLCEHRKDMTSFYWFKIWKKIHTVFSWSFESMFCLIGQEGLYASHQQNSPHSDLNVTHTWNSQLTLTFSLCEKRHNTLKTVCQQQQ